MSEDIPMNFNIWDYKDPEDLLSKTGWSLEFTRDVLDKYIRKLIDDTKDGLHKLGGNEPLKQDDTLKMKDIEPQKDEMSKQVNKATRKKRDPLTKSIRHEVFMRDGYKCRECGAKKDDIPLTIDHIVPVSRGGTDELHNLQTLCNTCNMAKGIMIWYGNIYEQEEKNDR